MDGGEAHGDAVGGAEGFEDGVALAAGWKAVDEDGLAAVDDDAGAVGWDGEWGGAQVDVGHGTEAGNHAAHGGGLAGFDSFFGGFGGGEARGAGGCGCGGFGGFDGGVGGLLGGLEAGGGGGGEAAPGGEVADEDVGATGATGEDGG